MKRHWIFGWVALTSALWLAQVGVSADTTGGPQVRVSNVRRVFHNGEHNAFTDLVRFRGKFYLTFRSCPDGHMVHPTASVIVLESDDAHSWRPVFQFSVKHRDTRDPHFLVFQDRLFVYSGTWYSGETSIPREQYDRNKHLGYAAVTDDGQRWEGPVMLEGTYGHYVWRAASFQGKAYLCGRRRVGFFGGFPEDKSRVESVMLESDDGLIWRKRATFQESYGDETAFLFEPSGEIIAVGRRGRTPAELIRSAPPYTRWQRKSLRLYIGGPLIAKWGQRTLVGGRKFTDDGPRTAIYWLVGDELQQFAELPSDDDNSYPGFVPLDEERALLSWYSSHERDNEGRQITTIYMADLSIRN